MFFSQHSLVDSRNNQTHKPASLSVYLSILIASEILYQLPYTVRISLRLMVECWKTLKWNASSLIINNFVVNMFCCLMFWLTFSFWGHHFINILMKVFSMHFFSLGEMMFRSICFSPVIKRELHHYPKWNKVNSYHLIDLVNVILQTFLTFLMLGWRAVNGTVFK